VEVDKGTSVDRLVVGDAVVKEMEIRNGVVYASAKPLTWEAPIEAGAPQSPFIATCQQEAPEAKSQFRHDTGPAFRPARPWLPVAAQSRCLAVLRWSVGGLGRGTSTARRSGQLTTW
jgi:hypothetical protein